MATRSKTVRLGSGIGADIATRRAVGAALTPDALLAPYPACVRSLARDIRKLVGAAVPTQTERALPGWRAVGFRDPHAGHVGALFPFEDHLKLYLEFGARLQDPHGLLEGTTKQTRFVMLRPGKRVPRRALASLVRDAVALQSL